MSVTTTSTPSKVTLPPLSSILYTPSKDVSSLHLLSNTSLVSASTPNTTFNDSTLHKFNTSRTFSFTSSPILKKSISFPLVGLPAPIQFPSLNANISQSRYTLTNSTPSSSLSAFPSSNNAILQLQQACKTSTTSATTSAPPATATATAATLTTTIEQPLAESSFIHSTPLVKRTKSVPLPSTTATATATIKPKFKIQPLFKIPIVAHPTPIEGTNTATTNVQNSRKRSRSDSSTSSTSNTASSFAFISHSQQTFLSNEPDIDNARLARRKRRRTSPLELSILQDEFLKGITPNKKRREEIASRVDMTEKAVQIWFQNRRQALRKAAPSSSSTRRASTNDCNNNGKMVFIKYDAKGNSIDEESRYEYSTSDDSNDSNDTDATDNDDNKENINSAYTKNEQTNAQSLRGLQASNSFRNPLRDITDAANNVISSANANANVISTSNLKARTQKFKHTHFGLVERNGVPQRRQKPTMKVKVQNGNASNGENFFYGSQGLIIKD